MMKLKTLNRNKLKEIERSCENVNSEDEAHSSSEYNVQTLIRPQLTNPKVFWSKSEDEEFSSSDSRNMKNAVLEEKIITNVFKPIRSGASSEIKRVKGVKSRSGKNKSQAEKNERSIHESLRIQKVRRRTRLPFYRDDKPSQDSGQKTQTYDPNYYSSLMKGISQDCTDYYSSSSSRKIAPDSRYPVRSVSDELIYGEKKTTARLHLEVEDVESKSERISVTEPSSPLTSDYTMEASKKHDSSDSDADSESTAREIVSELKKSKSFIEKNEAEGYFTSKPRPKTSTLEICRYSQSSSSSCDSALRSLSLQKITKNKRKSELREVSKTEYYSRNQSHTRQPKKQWAENSGKMGNPETMLRRSSDFGVVRKEKSQPCGRDLKTEEALQQISPDVFQHLIDILLQKNRTEFPDEKQKEFFTKSLPRNISRRLKDDRSGKEAFKVIKSVLEKDSYGKSQQFLARKHDDSEHGFLKPSNPESADVGQRRRPETEGEFRIKNNGHQHSKGGKSPGLVKNDKSSDGIQDKAVFRERAGGNHLKQCVFKIEDKKLWFDICKAVERVDAKSKTVKKFF